MKKGICAVAYDDNGQHYFLITQNDKKWGFVKAELLESEEEGDGAQRIVREQLGLSAFQGKKIPLTFTLGETQYGVYLITANMNTPVHIHEQYSTYLWASKESTESKLEGMDKQLLEKVVPLLS